MAIAGLLVLAGLTTFAVSIWAHPVSRLDRALDKARREARGTGTVASGEVVMVFFRLTDTRHSLAFETEVLPQLQQDFGDKLRVIRSVAWAGLPSPTLVIRGQREERVLYQHLDYESLRETILDLQRGP